MKQKNLNRSQDKLRKKFLKLGVKMVGPETIYFSTDTKIGKNVTIEPYVVFGPKVKIRNGVIIKSFSHIEECSIGNNVEIGGGSGVIRDIPNDTKVMGYPAKNIREFLRDNK